jgi:hypothetical protein
MDVVPKDKWFDPTLYYKDNAILFKEAMMKELK